jgi:hypothetical protein
MSLWDPCCDRAGPSTGTEHTLPAHTFVHLPDVIDEYGRMRRLEGFTPQSRGQEFNGLIADMLRCWGVERVDDSVRSVGEIDVTFVVDGMRFILEAKWEKTPTDFGALSKHRGRIEQRFTGTHGVFVSMAGYTPEAVEDLLRGHRPDMLLLDASHLEAMLSGLLSPQKLLAALLDRASFRSEIYTPLKDLVPTHMPPRLPPLAFGPPDDPSPVITETVREVSAQVILHGTEPRATSRGLTAQGLSLDERERLLLTMTEGIVRVDLGSGVLDWVVPLPGCRAAPLPRAVGNYLVIRGAAVLRWDGAAFHILAGGFTGNSALLVGPGDEVWVFDHQVKQGRPVGGTATMTRLGAALGSERRYRIDCDSPIYDAVWLEDHRLFLAADGHFAVIDLDATKKVEPDHFPVASEPHLRGTIRLDEHAVMLAALHGSVYRYEDNGQVMPVVRHNTLGIGCELASGLDGHAYLLAHQGPPQACVPIVIALSGY